MTTQTQPLLFAKIKPEDATTDRERLRFKSQLWFSVFAGIMMGMLGPLAGWVDDKSDNQNAPVFCIVLGMLALMSAATSGFFFWRYNTSKPTTDEPTQAATYGVTNV